MAEVLIRWLILLPIVTGSICLVVKKSEVRAGIVYLTAVFLIGSSILLAQQWSLPLKYYAGPTSKWIVLVLGMVMLAYIVFVAAMDIRRRGVSLHSVLTIVVALAAVTPIAVFQFALAPEVPLVANPALYVDHFSLLRGILISVTCPLICVYAVRYMKNHEEHRTHLGELKGTRQPSFFFYMLVLIGAMNGVAFSDNLLWLAFFWGLTTLCAYALIRHDETPKAIAGAFRTLWICLIGNIGFSVAIILSWYSPLNTISLSTLIANGAVAYPVLFLPFALLCVAGITKAAQIPFHGWGIKAALVSPAPVHAILHPFMTTGVFIVLYMSPGFVGTQFATFLAIFGAASSLSLGLIAISQRGSISILVCSAISNLALIIVCAGIGTPLALTAGVMLVIFLTISMILLYLCAGTIEQHIRSNDVENMEGLARRQPLLTGITMTAILSLLVAPFGILLSKWATIQAAAVIGIWSSLVLALLMLSIGAATVFWAKWLGRILCQSPTSESARLEPFVSHYHGVLLTLLGFAVLSSVFIAPLYNAAIVPIIVGAGYDPTLAFTTEAWFLRAIGGVFAGWPIFIVVAIVLLLPLATMKAKPEATRPAFMCGENVEIGSDEFVAVADERTPLMTGGFYIEGLLGEQRLDRFVIPAGIVLLVILFAMVAI